MKNLVHKNPRELSFTIFETIVAVGLLMAFTLEIAGGQGNLINKVEYARRSNDAIWLAKRIMSQVEYNYATMDLKELETTSTQKDLKFAGIDPGDTDFDYTYSVEVKEWKFPLFDFLLKGGAKSEEEENDPTKPDKQPEGAGIPGVDSIIKQIFGDHLMKIAHVEVSWPEGARRDSVSLTYLLTNTKALDEFLATKKTTFDGIIKKMAGNAAGGISPTGPVCTPAEPPESRNAPGNGGCIYPDNSVRTPDGSRYSETGELISKPIPQTPPSGGGGTTPGGTTTPPPAGGGVMPPGGIKPPVN